MNGLIQDLRYGLRQVLKSPGFAAVAVLTFALGIGANTAIFSVVNAVLLRPLAFKDADGLVRIWHVPPKKSFPGMTTFAVSAANYLDWQNQNHVFSQMAIYTYHGLTYTGGDKPEQVDASAVSSEFFSTLGVQPMLGRVPSAEEDQPGRSQVAVLSHRFWQDHFGSSREIVGHQIALDGTTYLVAGVMPPSFRFPDFAEVWTPMAWTDRQKAVRGEHHYLVIARLKPGVDVHQAQAEMNTISSRLEQQYPDDDKGWGAIVRPLRDDLVSGVRPALLVLFGAVGFILLIACVNVANLSLAKTFSRHKEIAIRTALGASSLRVLRQIVAESAVLAFGGGALGLAFARYGSHFIVAFLGDRLPKTIEVGLSVTVLAFTALVSVLTGALAGILPGVHLTRANVNQALKQGLGRTDVDSSGNRIRRTLVILEVSLSLILLIGAGLMIRSFESLRAVDPGFRSERVLTVTAAVSRTKFSQAPEQVSFFERVLERVRALPGVVSAGVTDSIPLRGGSHQPIAAEGHPVVPMSEQPEVDVRLISSGYLDALRIPIVRGRDFTNGDVAGRPATILISRSLAEQLWPKQNPLGRHISLTFFPGVSREVVGVVGDVKLDGLDQTRPTTALYVPLGQLTPAANAAWNSFPMTLVIRSAANPTNLISTVTSAVHGVDPEIPLRDAVSMDELVAESLAQPRLNFLLLGGFALLALILATIGIYSVLSYSVRQRVQEIGIRLALGASLNDVLRMIVLEGMKPALLGLIIGTVGALALGQSISTLIFGIRSTDPITFLAVAVLLATTALLATIIPAYRAAKVDPMVALRYE
jgi:putative ABC transport system permease protein